MMTEDKLVYYGYLVIAAFLAYLIVSDIYAYLIVIGVMHFVYGKLQNKFIKTVEANKRGVVITGCDTGFGHQIAIRLAERGFTVFAGCLLPNGEGAKALKAKKRKNLHVLDLDVSNGDSVRRAVNVVKELLPSTGLWAVLNNAAINRMSEVELCSIETMKQVAEINYYGMVRVTQAFLPQIRESKGRIINVTSVKGRIALPADVAYISTKWAGEAFSDILRREMRRFGVKVVIIEPGNFGGITGMLNEDNRKRVEAACNKSWENATEDVKQAYGRSCIDQHIKGLGESGATSALEMDPVIDAMEDAIVSENPKYRYLIHGGKKFLDWYCICAIMNGLLPEWIVDNFIDYTSPQPKVTKQVN